MITKIKLSSCIDRPENGLIHAMDILNHHRKYNLTEDNYNEIKSLILDNDQFNQAEIIKNDKQIKIVLMSKNDDEYENLFKTHQKLF